jgi:hypothetical protein
MTKSSTPTKADLYQMLAEAVRNTQPQPPSPPPEPPLEVRPAPKRVSRPRNTQPAPKRTAKTKRERASASRKQRRR